MHRILPVALMLLLAGCTGDNDDTTPEPTVDESSYEETELTFSDAGTILVGTQGVDACGVTGVLDTVSHTWTIPDEVNGTNVKGKDFTIDLSMGLTGLDIDLFVFGPDGASVGESTAANFIDGSTTEMVIVPLAAAGDYTIDVVGCLAVAADYSLSGMVTLIEA